MPHHARRRRAAMTDGLDHALVSGQHVEFRGRVERRPLVVAVDDPPGVQAMSARHVAVNALEGATERGQHQLHPPANPDHG